MKLGFIKYNKCVIDHNQGSQFILEFFNQRWFIGQHHPEYGWFRIFGVGLKWKHKKRGLLFSERIGKRKYVKIGRWIVRYLPKN